MKRSRKWIFVAQEAQRLADLGLRPVDIARRLEVNEGSVSRWIKAGKLTVRRKKVGGEDGDIAPSEVHQVQSPEEWAAEVRRTYDLDPTDDQLVTLAEALLMTARTDKSPTVRRGATAEFRGIVKQLALVARAQPAQRPEPETPKKPLEIVRRTDPRRSFMSEAG